MDYSSYWLFEEIASIAKDIRYSILHSMPKEYRMEIGNEIRSLLRTLKFRAYSVSKYGRGTLDCNSIDYLTDTIVKLKINLDDCLEDGLLLDKGPYTIIPARKRLMEVSERIEHNDRGIE